MRDLQASLLQHDLALLRVIGENWGLDLTGLSPRLAAERLAETILEADLPAEIADLTADEQAVIQTLLASNGKILVDPFTRQFGPIRPFGPGRLARERPWANPKSPAEAIWYRGLLFRAFEQTDLGSQELIYLPREVRNALPQPPLPRTTRPELVPAEGKITHHPANNLVNDCCTLLAFIRSYPVPAHPHPLIPEKSLLPYLCYKDHARLGMIWALALDAGMLHLDDNLVQAHSDRAREWLQASYPEQAALLAQTWLTGRRWNDLWQVPALRPETTGWQNDPLPPRQLILNILSDLSPKTWWLLESLPAGVKATNPDFQRTAGDYDSWYIRAAETGEYLLGYQHWDQVEGALLRFLVTGPLAWLGLVELGENAKGAIVAFRPTPVGRTFLEVKSFPYPAGPAMARIRVYADATIVVPAAVSRMTRFQIARLTEWEPQKTRETTYRYRLTPHSLERAKQSGITLSRTLAFLASKSGHPLPESVKKAVESWGQRGTEVRLREIKVLQVRDQTILDQLRAAPAVRPMLGETIGPLAIEVRTADWPRLVSAIAELGLLSSVQAPDPDE